MAGKLEESETYTEREDALRARGNVLYGEVAAGGGGNAAGKRSKLQRAQELYEEGLQLSCNSEKRASFCKNLGALHYLWGKVELELMPSWNEPGGGGSRRSTGAASTLRPAMKLSDCKEHLGQAMSFFVRAHVEGARAQKPREWMQQVGRSLAGLVTWAAEQSSILALPGTPILKHVCEELKNLGRNNLAFKVEAEALANVELASCLFHISQSASSEASNGQAQVVVMGPPAGCDEPLNHAKILLKSLPSSPTTEILKQRIKSLRSEFFPGTNFHEFFHQFQEQLHL